MQSGAQTQPETPDEEIISRFQATGDPQWFAELFFRHRTRVYLSCRRFFSDDTVAQDATQETFLRAYQGIHGFRGDNVCGWVMRIAKNVCIDLWRRRRPEMGAVAPDSVDIAEPPNLERLATIREAMMKVEEEMKSLSLEQRRCLEMKMEGYSYHETAERTGLSVGEVKSHLQNGRRMLWMRVEGILSQLL